MQTPQEVPSCGIRLKLTFHLYDDWLRLNRFEADAQSAAIFPSVCSLHMVNAVTQYMRTHVRLCNLPVTQLFTSIRYIPDSGEESYDPVRDGLELIDHNLHVSCQFLAVPHPDNGGLQPGIGNVDGAVEFSLMAL